MKTNEILRKMDNWVVLDENLKAAWEREASIRISEIRGKKISIEITLPTLEAAARASKKNENLYGTVIWHDNEGHSSGVVELLPFHGVFILNNSRERRAQAAVWNSYLEPLAKEEHERVDVDDLAKRRLMTFPRKLLNRLCMKMKEAKDIFDAGYWERKCLVPATTWLESRASLLRRANSNNAIDLMSQIAGVRRYLVSRAGAMGYAIAKRMNHPSFDGRICPVDTPESEMVGISLQLARGAWVDKDGEIHPAESESTTDRVSWGTAQIPFSHNNDGARDMMSAKNLRQATPVLGREVPSVRTGAETALAVAMAPLMEAGICPESRDADKSCIAMGRDLLVAYMPWNGWNLDDAIVVSESVASAMSVIERKTFSRQVEARFRLERKAECGVVSCGAVIASFCDPKGKRVVIRYNDEKPAKLVHISCGGTGAADDGNAMQTLSYELEKEIPLGLGDKLMARHGNKGVVGRVLPETEMPHLPDDERLPEKMRGKPVEIIVNPHGVLSRMNPGQLIETHLGWLFKAGGCTEDNVRASDKTGAVGAPQVGMLDYDKIQGLLEKTGLDRRGKTKLMLPSGGQTANPVVVGYEHFVRLHHIPELKAQARACGEGESYNHVTQQPAHGRKVGGGQRLGEMEVWALCAHGADRVLEEMLGAKSDKDWARDWDSADAVPSGVDDSGTDRYGFAHLMRDWLRALCIDFNIDRENGQARFRFLSDAAELKSMIGGDAKRVVSDDACTMVKSGRFSCRDGELGNLCGWSFPGQYPLPADARRGKTLKFGAVLTRLGYDGAGPLKDDGSGQFTVELRKSGLPAGELAVNLNNYNSNDTTLNLEVSPSKDNPPAGWPSEKDFSKIFLRAKPMASKQECKKFGLDRDGKRQIPLLAEFLLDELKDVESNRNLTDDCSVVCPNHQTQLLKIGPPYDVEPQCAKGGLFDPDIFAGKDDWGYIELPESIEYPYRKKKKGKSQPKTGAGVQISIIPVLPLHYRKRRDKEALGIDSGDVSHYYQTIIRLCRGYEKADADAEEEAKKKKMVAIKKSVADLFRELARRLEKKHGFLRRDGLGRRVDRSFRLVITPNPDILWDQAGVPTAVLWEILGDMVEFEETHGTDGTDCGGERVMEWKAGWTWHKRMLPPDAHKRLCKFLQRHPDLVVLLNRQPSLHRYSMQAFHPVAVPPKVGETLQLSPLCCVGFAADFDGDEMAGHLPLSSAAQEDARKMLPSRNLRSIATGACLANLDRDLVTGLELIHRCPERYRDRIDAEFDKEGVEFDQDAVGLMMDKALAPGKFGERLFALWCERDPDSAARKIGAVSRIAFRACTDEGISFGYFDLIDAKIEPVDADNAGKGDWRVVKGDPSLALIVNSGANGSKQIRQIVKGRGKLETVDASGKMSDVDIGEVSLSGGMPWNLYFAASQNARYSMCQKKIGTQKAGHLTRQLVLGLWGWTIAEEDCGDDSGERSVLTCKCAENGGRGICAKCFGKLPDGTEPWIGMPIGLIAAQTLGERGTQLSMRVFHAGGREMDFTEVAELMRNGEKAKNGKQFVESLRQGPYAKIDERYFQLLWRALDAVPNKKLTSIVSDPFAKLAKGSQMDRVLEYAKGKKSCSLDSPFARVFFNIFGGRDAFRGEES